MGRLISFHVDDKPLSSPSQIYPDEGHYFHSVALKQHLYRSIIGFFVECFRIQDKLPTTAAKEDEEED